MYPKIWTLISLLTLTAAIEYQQHVIPTEQNFDAAHRTPAAYSFQYRVHDQHTGDIKGHSEIRNGDRVDGQYDLIDPDGHKRIVQYVANRHIGFQATVHRHPTGVRIQAPSITHKRVQAPLTGGLAYGPGQHPEVHDNEQSSN